MSIGILSDGTLDETLVSSEFLANPYPILRLLRDEDPIYWSDSIGGWVLTKYDDILETFKRTDIYSNEGRLGRAIEYLPLDLRSRLTTFEDHYRTKGLLHSDPPDHTRLKSLVQKAFSPRMIDAMRPRIQSIIDELIDAVQPAGRMEVIQDLAFALPVSVLALIMGVPSSDSTKFRHWADSLLAFQGVNKPNIFVLERAQATLVEMREYLRALIQKRRSEPGEDLVSELVTVEQAGERLTEDELINTCVTLLVAAHDTTTSLIGNGLFLLLQHPEQWQALQAHPERLAEAIEEILRFESPVARQPRLVKQDTQLGGKQIKRGQMAFQMLNAANRDLEHFEEPDVFDIGRPKNRHLAFGQGVHFCIGAPLSRAEGLLVFQTILNRLPQIRLKKAEPDWDLEKPNSRVLKTLHVEF